jgi:uncharacterized protein (TIGR02246 family)
MNDSERIAIERECERLMIDYAAHADFRDNDAFANLFAEDGELNLTGQPARGRDAIRRGMELRPANRESRHVITNMSVKVIDDNRAEGVCYLTLYRKDAEGGERRPFEHAGPDIVGDYHDVYVKTGAGWKIKSRRIRVAFRAPA